MKDERSESMEMLTNLSSAHRGQDWLPIYENSHEYVPGHWIPIFGAGHGMFYDVATNDFRGDGLPRPSFERLSGTIPGRHPRRPRLLRPWEQPAEFFHIQPTVFTSQVPQASPNHAHGMQHQYFCSCTGSWLLQGHDCIPEQLDHEARYMDAAPALRSVQDLHDGWVTRRVLIGNMLYLRIDSTVAMTDFAAERQAAGLMAIDNQDVSAGEDMLDSWMFGESSYDEAKDYGYGDVKEQQATDVPKDQGLGDKPISTRSQERKRARAKKKAKREEAAAAKEEEEKKIGKEPGDDGSAPDNSVVNLSGLGEEVAKEEKKTGKEPEDDASASDSHAVDLSSVGEEAAEEKKKIRQDDPGDDGSAPNNHIVDLSGIEYFFF
ncbi:MAG: hypothetical protein LQ342_000297 [Letrouitia transgressa]|nr:MAG: hypothetical protein LQ342_000297 [Letrouitia transgressa]